MRPAQGKQGTAALTNRNQEILDQIHDDNIVKHSWILIYRKKISKNTLFLEAEHQK